MAENKIKYGLSQVHYAPITSGAGGTAVFGTPVAIPGAVSLTLDAEGELTEFYADNMAYYVSAANNGYSGTLEVARIPDQFREDILKEVKDAAAGTLIEKSTAEPAAFALLFEFAGDVKATRQIMYNCAVTRPSVSGSTTTKSKEPTTESFKLKCSPLTSGVVKAKTLDSTDGTAYEGWYTAVWQPSPAK